MKIGYFQGMEKVHPAKALELAVLAEKLGFDMVATGDHFHPFFHSGAGCSFAWSWVSAVLARTENVSVGTAVTAPILRYHPAIVAQAWSTMAAMFPGRVFLGLGTGEAVNEVPLGYNWPTPRERVERLEEAVRIIRLLLESREFISFKGKYYNLNNAFLYTKPDEPPHLFVAAKSPGVARIAGKYADGIMTVPQHYSESLHDAVKRAALDADRDPSRIAWHLDMGFSYDKDYDRALDEVMKKAGTLLPFVFKYSVSDPREIEAHAKYVSREAVAANWCIFTSYEEPIKMIESYAKRGFTHFHMESLSPNEEEFVRYFASKVLPYFKDSEKK